MVACGCRVELRGRETAALGKGRPLKAVLSGDNEVPVAVVTEGSGIAKLRLNQGKLIRTQEQVATGRSILRPSDDPIGAARSLSLTRRIANVARRVNNRLNNLLFQLDCIRDRIVKLPFALAFFVKKFNDRAMVSV